MTSTPEPYPFTDDSTLGEVRAWIRQQAADRGAKCPACTQYARVYKRSLNSPMVRLLIRAYRSNGQAWFHVRELRDGTGDFAKLRWWGLVEESAERRADGGRVGMWRITDLGVDFLRHGCPVQKYAQVYDNTFLGHDGPNILIQDALGEGFNLAELMAEGAGVAPELDPAAGQ